MNRGSDRITFFQPTDRHRKVLGIVYRAIATDLTHKASYTKARAQG